jgi:hypothetical protein
MKVKWLPINHGHKFPKSVVPHCRKTNANLDEIVELAKQLLGSTVGSCRRLLLGSTVDFCWDRPSALAGIDRRLLLGSTVSCKVSSANENCTRRFGAAERRVVAMARSASSVHAMLRVYRLFYLCTASSASSVHSMLGAAPLETK